VLATGDVATHAHRGLGWGKRRFAGTVRLWDAATGRELPRPGGQEEAAYALAFSGVTLVSIDCNGGAGCGTRPRGRCSPRPPA
jgi:hypothetical protein